MSRIKTFEELETDFIEHSNEFNHTYKQKMFMLELLTRLTYLEGRINLLEVAVENK